MKMIVTENLTRKFSEVTAVENLTFSVDRGEVFGLLGPNGAGKSTTVRMICCLIGKSDGFAQVGGWDTSDKEGAIRIRRSIGFVPDSVGMYVSMSAMRNLYYFGRLYDCPDDLIKENSERYLKLLDLWDSRDRNVSTYSKGMKQKLAIVRALVHDPEILIMDEPTANLDPAVSKTIRDLILDLKKENRTILLNTHNLDEAQRVCSRIGLLKTKLLALDTPENLEKSMSGRKTEIVLVEVIPQILEAISSRNPESLDREGNRLILRLSDPEKERPGIIAAVVQAGGNVQTVTDIGASLEDVYLKQVRDRYY